MKQTNNTKARKLSVNKTTIRHLNAVELSDAKGGLTNWDCSNTPNTCPRELTSENC
jgi:hypothetical protein